MLEACSIVTQKEAFSFDLYFTPDSHLRFEVNPPQRKLIKKSRQNKSVHFLIFLTVIFYWNAIVISQVKSRISRVQPIHVRTVGYVKQSVQIMNVNVQPSTGAKTVNKI